jgi:flagellin
MSLVLNTNIDSLIAQNSLTSSGSTLATALQQLSTGLRINSPADDAAGYAIVQGMTSQINGMNQAVQNANDGVSLVQTAAGALTEVTNDLQSMRSLAVESLNATNSSADRADLNQQFSQLSQDIDSVAANTQFNGVNLLDGTFQGETFQIGANANQSITVGQIASVHTAELGEYAGYNGNLDVTAGTASALSVEVGGQTYNLGSTATDASQIATALNAAGISGLSATANANVQTGTGSSTTDTGSSGQDDVIAINGINIDVSNSGTTATNITNAVNAINAVSGNTGVTAVAGTTGIQLTSETGANISVGFTAGTATGTNTASVATDYGLGTLASDATGTVTSYASSVAVTYQAPAGVTGNLVIDGAGLGTTSNAIAETGNAVSTLSVTSTDNANTALASITAAIQQVANLGAQLGAYQNRFQAAATGLATDVTNLSSARSNIQDTDYAAATSQLSQAQILQQASTAMVAQANTIPQNVLTLLQHLP